MLAKLKSNFASLSPSYRRLLSIALGLMVLLVLNRTVIRWALQYEADLQSEKEDLETKLQRLQEKRDSLPELVAQRQALQTRLQQEDLLVMPYESPNEAQNQLSGCLQHLAAKSELAPPNIQIQPVSDLGTHYQKVQAIARMNGLTQHWTRFLYEIEALRNAGEGAESESGCPALAMTIDELTVRLAGGRNQHEMSLMFKVSGIIRKPVDPAADPATTEAARPPRGRG